MKELDFLPASFHQAARRRLQTRRNLTLAAGLVMALACLHGLNATRIQSAEAALSALRNGSGGWQATREQHAALRAQKAVHEARASLIARLDDDAPLDATFGEITRLMTESMAIRSVMVDTRPAVSGEPAATRVRLCGIAATDVEVGVFLGKLGSSPLFTEVRLAFSQDARESGRRMREFEVRFALRPVEVER